MPLTLRTRFAPTPSGYLHLGNAWSFFLTWLAARQTGGRIHLRIDAYDGDRLRPEYVEDIFESLQWLGLDWDSGPADAQAFWSERESGEAAKRHRQGLQDLRTRHSSRVYACICSREEARRVAAQRGLAPGLYPGTCRKVPVNAETQGEAEVKAQRQSREAVLRWHVPDDTTVAVRVAGENRLQLHPGRDIGDFVIRGRSGEVAYQLASVLDDESLGINFIVRGMDLLPSTGAQLDLAQALNLPIFPKAYFLHHALIQHGEDKLSKSDGAPSLQAMRRAGIGREQVLQFFAKQLDLDLGIPSHAADLLSHFRLEAVPERPLRFEEF